MQNQNPKFLFTNCSQPSIESQSECKLCPLNNLQLVNVRINKSHCPVVTSQLWKAKGSVKQNVNILYKIRDQKRKSAVDNLLNILSLYIKTLKLQWLENYDSITRYYDSRLITYKRKIGFNRIDHRRQLRTQFLGNLHQMARIPCLAVCNFVQRNF